MRGTDALRVLVRAPYPALRAGLGEMLRASGLIAVEDDPRALDVPALGDTAIAEVDVLVVDVGDDEPAAVEDARGLEVPVVFLRASRRAPRLNTVAGAPAEGWLARDASAEELGAAVRAVAAGLTVLDPAFARPPDSVDAIANEAANDARLTARELDVLRQMALGLPNKAIAQRLGISEHTVKFHVGAVLSKLEARSRTEAVTLAARAGLLAL